MGTSNNNEPKQTDDESNKAMGFIRFNFFIALLGWLIGGTAPPNDRRSELSNAPIPDDIRGNKKDGDEYDTIGDVLRKGGKRKAVLIAVIVLLAILALIKAYYFLFDGSF